MSNVSPVYVQPGGGQILCLFDHYTSVGNVGTTETDLYSDTIVGGTLAVDGDKLEFMYSGTTQGNVIPGIFRIYFAGTELYESGIEDGLPWTISGTIVRVSASIVRYSITLYGGSTPTIAPAISVGELTGLTLSDSNILKISVECTAPDTPDDSAIAVLGSVKWISHA